MLTLCAVLVIHYTTYVHPFVVSDNRHFIFYIWRKFLARDVIRYSMGIVYAVASIMLARLMIGIKLEYN